MALEKFFQIVGRYQRSRSNFEYWKFAVSNLLIKKAAAESCCYTRVFYAVRETFICLHGTLSFSVVRLDCREYRWILALREFKIASVK
jgi:hypothetical protein